MNEKPKKQNWAKQHPIWVAVISILAITGIASAFSDSSSVSTPTPTPTRYYAPIATHAPTATQMPVVAPDNGLSNDNYYKNVSGNEVHSPARSNTIPVGASAQCRDGTYSFSQNRRGTCSHHGGVSQWL